MNRSYIKLFMELSHAIEIMSEQVMEYNKSKEDEKGIKTAQTMRDEYVKLYDRLNSESFEPDSLTRADYARLLVGAMVVAKQIENRIEENKKALTGYQIDMIPKLKRILDETDNDESVRTLANEIFQVKEKDE